MSNGEYKVLAVIDMQNDFITGSLGNEACRDVVPEVVKVIVAGDYDEVFLTRDTHDDNYLQTQEGRKLPVIHTQRDTEGWQIQEDVWKAVTDNYRDEQIQVIDKGTFGSEKLALKLKELGLEKEGDGTLQIDFVGVCTDICVINNVFLAKAAVPEATVCVIAGACAGVTPASHQTALDAMENCQIDIVETVSACL